MKRPRTFYLTKFPLAYYHNRTWWRAGAKDRALAFLKHVEEKYEVKGELIKVKECR